MASFAALPILLAVHAGVILAAVAGAVLVGLLLWQLLGPGPRRARAARRAERLLAQGQWEEALRAVRGQQGQGALPAAWQRRLRKLEGDCLLAAGDQALKERRYEDALGHYREAAPLVGAAEGSQLRHVVEA